MVQVILEKVSLELLGEIVHELGHSRDIATLRSGGRMLQCGLVNGLATAMLIPGDAAASDAFRIATFEFEVTATLEQANAWNTTHNFGSVTIDEDGNPWLEMYAYIKGGVTRDFLRQQFMMFDAGLKQFSSAFGTR